MYLQGYAFLLRDIPGKTNKTADWLSRMYPSATAAAVYVFGVYALSADTPEFYFSQVLGGDNPHWGAQRTWKELNEAFPGHRIPFALIDDLVRSCPTCQKTRLGMKGYSIAPSTRHLKVPHARSRVGIDRLAISPTSRNGSNNLIVIVEAFTHYVAMFAAKDYSALTLASCLAQYAARSGLFEELISEASALVAWGQASCQPRRSA